MDRRRYKKDGKNLDLSYITPRVIAMAFPATSFLEKTWRNSIGDVCSTLEKDHPSCWMVWNLSERDYNADRLYNRIINASFVDHHPPPLIDLLRIVDSIYKWLNADESNMAVVHCIGGKGRTGTIISSYLLLSGICRSAEDSTRFFARARSRKDKGVTQCSQRRYVGYFEHLLREEPINLKPIGLMDISIGPINLKNEYGIEIYDSPYKGELIFSEFPIYKSNGREEWLSFNINEVVHKDLYIKFVKKKAGKISVKFHIVLHTYFINESKIILDKENVDWMSSNENFPDEMVVEIMFSLCELDSDISYEPDPEILQLKRTYESFLEEKRKREQSIVGIVDPGFIEVVIGKRNEDSSLFETSSSLESPNDIENIPNNSVQEDTTEISVNSSEITSDITSDDIKSDDTLSEEIEDESSIGWVAARSNSRQINVQDSLKDFYKYDGGYYIRPSFILAHVPNDEVLIWDENTSSDEEKSSNDGRLTLLGHQREIL
eukprot:TRINITY_DN12118_c0_g1_i1.p1 TRINITY_DN12118_c0_g1~~TRINITY_DN12118_c0_g1_i1.p1  ORF type:complete len:514 (+),score=102.03 TRINITY_DN12118_c0_g1_i1:72-1544(+)